MTVRPRRLQARPRGGRGLLIVPPVAMVLAVLVAPIVLIALYSVDVKTNLPFTPTKFTWSMWRDFLPPSQGKFPNPFWHRFEISMVITVVVSLVAVVAAYPLAYFLAFVFRRSRYTLLLLMLAPFFTSYLLRVIAWKIMLSNNGVINTAIWDLHLRTHGDGIPWLIYSKFSVGLVLFYSWVPFVAVPIFVLLDRMDTNLLEAAQDLEQAARDLPAGDPAPQPARRDRGLRVRAHPHHRRVHHAAPHRGAGQPDVRQLDPVLLPGHAELELRGGARTLAGGGGVRDAARLRAIPGH